MLRSQPRGATAQGGVAIAPVKSPIRDDRWLALFVFTRVLATATAVGLLLVWPEREHDGTFAVVALAYGLGTTLLAIVSGPVRSHPVAWGIDIAACLALILLTSEWRNPFYLLSVTALVFPATTLSFPRALITGCGFTAAYIATAFATGLTLSSLDSTERLETLATHVLVPLLVSFSLAYATKLLRRLEGERERSERLAVETERRRIAWELHDSSKQRVHAAHLVLSQLPGGLEGSQRRAVEQALDELSRAATDMDASLWELRAPLETERLEDRLRVRADELRGASNAQIAVTGTAPPLPGWVSTHVYRIAAEALTNAVRHGSPNRIEVAMQPDGDELLLSVVDDGSGVQNGGFRPSNGLASMSARATAIEGRLDIEKGPQDRGTAVRLRVPVRPTKGAPE